MTGSFPAAGAAGDGDAVATIGAGGEAISDHELMIASFAPMPA